IFHGLVVTIVVNFSFVFDIKRIHDIHISCIALVIQIPIDNFIFRLISSFCIFCQSTGRDLNRQNKATYYHETKRKPLLLHISPPHKTDRSEEHTSELQSRFDIVCRLLLEKKKKK